MVELTRTILRWLAAILFISAGTYHFVRPELYRQIIPPGFPAPELLVAVSGVAEIAGGLARQGINIHALLQRPGYPEDRLPFVVTVEPCSTSALKRALQEIGSLDCLIEPPLELQILEPETAAL